MFHSATAKLTCIYVTLLFVVSAFFSINWYQAATAEIDRALARQQSVIEETVRRRGLEPLQNITPRTEQLQDSKQATLQTILYVNAFILVIGGYGSYVLAQRTLKPIRNVFEMQQRFIGDASHELRTPIAVMKAELEVQLRKKSLSKAHRRQFESLLEETNQLEQLSNSLLEMARLDAITHAEMQPVKVVSIVNKAKKQVQPLAQQKSIQIVQEVSTATVKADPILLKKLLVILLDNAIKYSGSDSTVKILGDADGSVYRITVADRGRGIKPSDQVRVFERFYRVDSARTKQHVTGHGLGLAMAQAIAKQHGSQVKLVSEPDKGSEFSFELSILDEA